MLLSHLVSVPFSVCHKTFFFYCQWHIFMTHAIKLWNFPSAHHVKTGWTGMREDSVGQKWNYITSMSMYDPVQKVTESKPKKYSQRTCGFTYTHINRFVQLGLFNIFSCTHTCTWGFSLILAGVDNKQIRWTKSRHTVYHGDTLLQCWGDL